MIKYRYMKGFVGIMKLTFNKCISVISSVGILFMLNGCSNDEDNEKLSKEIKEQNSQIETLEKEKEQLNKDIKSLEKESSSLKQKQR